MRVWAPRGCAAPVSAGAWCAGRRQRRAGAAGRAACFRLPKAARVHHTRTQTPAASANATKKSFGLDLQEARQGNASSSGGGAAADGATAAAAGKPKARKFPFLGMPADANWIL